MQTDSLLAISPLDGRYARQTTELVPYFSELALIRYRIRVEVEYLIALASLNLKNCPPLPEKAVADLRQWSVDIGLDQGRRVKDIERTLNHDVKAVEYAIKEKLMEMGLESHVEFVHFGLTSQDINNTAIPLSLQEFLQAVWIPRCQQIRDKLRELGQQFIDLPMLARTHGQAASPTRFGKEVLVFAERLDKQLEKLVQIRQTAKFGGATGNFNAHVVAYPAVNWPEFADAWVASLGLERSRFTTQIEHYDTLAETFHGLSRVQTILVDLCRDFWQYISMDYLKQKVVAGEVGSSAMPHKVNPIDFENAEGNFGYANAILGYLAEKLPVSRLQRDLTDSTVLRNLGVPLGHGLVALSSLERGLGKIEVNRVAILRDLHAHPEVLAEAIQTLLRREGYPKPYEALKELTRKGESITPDTIREFIEKLDVSTDVKQELLRISVESYIGVSPGNR